MKRRNSFTLIEVLLAITIIVMIMGSVYAFYSHSIKMTQMAEAQMQDAQIARVILLKIASELRGVTASGSRFGTVMTGEAERIDFITTAVPSRLVFFPQDITDKGRLFEHDLRLVQYSLARDEDDEDIIYGFRRDELRCLLTSLIEKKTFDKLTQDDIDDINDEQKKFTNNVGSDSNSAMANQPLITQTMLCDRIKYLRFDYYDGKKWLVRWKPSEPDAIPKAVKVTIGFTQVTDEEYERESLLNMEDRLWVDDRYELMVSLILSDDLKAEYTEQESDKE